MGMLPILLIFPALLVPTVYRLYFHPLRHIPGPFVARTSSIFLYIICYFGVEGRVLRHYHQHYKAKVLRIAPNSVSVSDPTAIRDIYITSGGFPKDARYQNFNLGPVESIFSTQDTEYRDTRAKVVAPLFAHSRLREASKQNGIIGCCVAEFVDQLRKFRTAGVKVDIVDLCARLSIDIVTGYLLGSRYGGFDDYAHLTPDGKRKQKLSANPFIFAIVAFSRFSLLPNWLFKFYYAVSTKLGSNKEVVMSFARLNRFTDNVMKSALVAKESKDANYPARLLKAGISFAEAATQSNAIVFAGADSTAVMLSTILFHLVRNADAHATLQREIRSSKVKATSVDPQSLPYLCAVIKEGLRLGMANPTRLTRIVPSSDFRVGDVHIPRGTIVGCAAYILHHDLEVFPAPFSFLPQRWIESGSNGELRRPKMENSMIPFGAGLRGCIGKNLAQQQLFESVFAVAESGVLEGSVTLQERIEMKEWFNGEIKGHSLDIEWLEK